MEKKFHFVYITTNLINGKQYIGDHSTNNVDSWKTKHYIGSGKYFKNALNEYGKNNFKREILEFFGTKQKAFSAQEKYIIKYKTLAPNGYNISPKGGYGVKGWYKHYEETKRKIGKANKIALLGIKRSEESKLKQSNTTQGHIVSKETRKKLRLANLGENNPMFGKKLSQETKDKMSKSRTGMKRNPHTQETKDKIRQTLLNKKQ
jgi:group I intron endonuclease